MVRIILFLLKCVVGVLAVVGLAVVAAGFLAQTIWKEFESRTLVEPLPDKMVLALDLSEGVAGGDSPLTLLGLHEGWSWLALGQALEAAAKDDRVAGLLLKVGGADLSLAEAQELRSLVADFRQSGKPVRAFAESFGEGGDGTVQYYTAAAADEIWMQPSGELGLTGFRLEVPLFGGVLDDWGVLPRLDHRGVYKGITETFTREDLSTPVRTNLQQLAESWLRQVARDIATRRKISATQVREIIDNGPYSAEEAGARTLVDKLGYLDEVEQAFRRGATADVHVLPLADYERRRAKTSYPDGTPTIAVIHGEGGVMLGKGQEFGDPTMASDDVIAAFDSALADRSVKAIVFRIDSPGGSAVASDAIWRAVDRVRTAGKPVVVSMMTMAASGGYYVAAPANRIFAQPATITGSIGVAGGKLVVTGLLRELNVGVDSVQAGRNAGFWSATEDFDDAQWKAFQASLDRTYDDFVDKVAKGRNLSRQAVLSAAEGQVWSGEDGQARGLVDSFGGLREAVAEARTLAFLPQASLVRVTDWPSGDVRLRRLVDRVVGGEVDVHGLPALLRLADRLVMLEPLLRRLEAAQAPGARLEAPVRAPVRSE